MQNYAALNSLNPSMQEKQTTSRDQISHRFGGKRGDYLKELCEREDDSSRTRDNIAGHDILIDDDTFDNNDLIAAAALGSCLNRR